MVARASPGTVLAESPAVTVVTTEVMSGRPSPGPTMRRVSRARVGRAQERDGWAARGGAGDREAPRRAVGPDHPSPGAANRREPLADQLRDRLLLGGLRGRVDVDQGPQPVAEDVGGRGGQGAGDS